MDWIRLVGVEIYGHHGVTPAERESGQKFKIDVELGLNLEPAGQSDDVNYTVDYRGVYRIVEEITKDRSYHLIEAMASDIASAILDKCDKTEVVIIRVKKPGAAIGGILEHAEVEIDRRREARDG